MHFGRQILDVERLAEDITDTLDVFRRQAVSKGGDNDHGNSTRALVTGQAAQNLVPILLGQGKAGPCFRSRVRFSLPTQASTPQVHSSRRFSQIMYSPIVNTVTSNTCQANSYRSTNPATIANPIVALVTKLVS